MQRHSRNIMHTVLKPSSNFMFDFQCSAFGGKISDTATTMIDGEEETIEVDDEALESPDTLQQDVLSLEDLVLAEWPDGFPVDNILKLSDAEIEQTRNWLVGANPRYWPNAVNILGLRGTPDDVEILLKMLSKPTGFDDEETSYLAETAKLNIPQALGHIAARLHSGHALGAVRSLLNPNNNQIFPLAADMDTQVELGQALATEATRALAIVSATDWPQAQAMMETQRLSQQAGAFDLGVEDDDFFAAMEELEATVRAQGLIEALRAD